MAATVTLATTTTTAGIDAFDRQVTLASTTGVVPGICLFMDQELVRVVSFALTPTIPRVIVQRGIDSQATPHGGSTVVTIGTADQFRDRDPVGPPPAQPMVSPWINVRNGSTWLAQGDDSGPEVGVRWWQKVVPTYGVGPLGIRTISYVPAS